MLIGVLSKRSGFSRDTIRYYEKLGLIKGEPSSSLFNNYKEYSEEVLRRLLVIKESKTFGFSLKEIGEILNLMEMEQANCQVIQEKIGDKLLELERQIQALRGMQKHIREKAEHTKLVCRPLVLDGNCPSLTKVTGQQ